MAKQINAPIVAASLPVSEYFRLISANEAPGAIVRHGSTAFFVSGKDLAQKVDVAGKKEGFRAATLKTIADYLPEIQKVALKSTVAIELFDVATDPLIWLCEDDDENTHPDNGYCSYCPKKIKGLKS